MPPMSSWMCRRIIGSMRERAACAGRRLYSQALEYLVRAATARLQPDFIEAQEVAIRMAVGALGEFVQSIDERLEFAGELGKDCTRRGPRACAAASVP